MQPVWAKYVEIQAFHDFNFVAARRVFIGNNRSMAGEWIERRCAELKAEAIALDPSFDAYHFEAVERDVEIHQ